MLPVIIEDLSDLSSGYGQDLTPFGHSYADPSQQTASYATPTAQPAAAPQPIATAFGRGQNHNVQGFHPYRRWLAACWPMCKVQKEKLQKKKKKRRQGNVCSCLKKQTQNSGLFQGNVKCTFCETETFVKAGMLLNWGENKPFFYA